MARRRLLQFVLVSLVTAQVGCLTPNVNVTAIAPPPRPLKPRAVEEVRVVRPPETVAGGVDIYLIEVSSGSLFRREPTLRAKAAELGCDAVRITEDGTPTRSTTQVNTGQLNSRFDDAPPALLGTCVVLTTTAKN